MIGVPVKGLYRGSIGIMENNGNYYIITGFILELYRDYGKVNGNYYILIGYI